MLKMPYRIIKRVFDILFSLTLLIIVSPLLALISFLVWITDRGEIFVKKPLRIGQNGKYFRMYKFRTMMPNAHQEILSNPKYENLKEKWEKNGNKLKLDEDIRITKIGKLLRKTDLDELPQLLNILKGEMSLVGPRPTYKDELERHFKSNSKDRKYLDDILNVKPGMTGIWQTSGRNEIPFSERLKIDSEYSRNLNFLTDFKILLRTPYIILTRKGAYE